MLAYDYYVAFANWQNKAALDRCAKSDAAKVLAKNGAQFMQDVIWSNGRQIPDDYLQRLDLALLKLRQE